MASPESLKALIEQKIGDARFVVASNREPYSHIFRKRLFQKGRVEWMRPASGMATGLEPVLRATGGLWVAFGSGNADRNAADERGRVRVPPDDPQFTLKRVWLTEREVAGYYDGFANETMWPLCHVAYVRPAFVPEDWETFREVNAKFAQAIREEVGCQRAFIWVQDFHLALLPRMLKETCPDLLVAQFWHIPWPTPELFRLCPWRREILEGLLANDLLGFHIRYDCDNFLAAVDRELEARVDRERSSVISLGHETLIRPFPISVDFERVSGLAESPSVRRMREEFRETYGLDSEALILGVDRFDYTKGIPERIRAVDRLLEKHPEQRGRVTLFQTGPFSRLHVQPYRELNEEVDALVAGVNRKHRTRGWQPVVLARRHMNEAEMAALYRMANLCIVSSLHDGMNLVAKEFVAARNDGDGVLVLSRFTGAARELDQAVLVNPFDVEGFAEALQSALGMSEEERRKRMAKMREVVREHNVYSWAEQFVSQLTRLA